MVGKIRTKSKSFMTYPAALCVAGRSRMAMFSTRCLYSDRYSIYPLASGDPGADQGRREGRCLHAPRPVWCQSARRSGVFLHTQERAAAAAEVRVSQSDQSGGGGSTACTQESCGGVSSFCRKKSLRSIMLQETSIQGAYSLTYQSTHWGIRSIGSERYRAQRRADWLVAGPCD